VQRKACFLAAAALPFGFAFTVLVIPQNRMSDLGQLHADLVLAARFDRHIQKRSVPRGFFDLVAGDGELRLFRFSSVVDTERGIFGELSFDAAGFSGGNAPDDRPVPFFSLPPVRLQEFFGRFRLRENNQA